MSRGVDLLLDGRVAWVTLNDPVRGNALGLGALEQLAAALDRVAGSRRARAVVITGRGSSFCAGDDLGELDGRLGPRGDVAWVRRAAAAVQGITRRLAALERPVIAAVNGPAVGLGAELAVACDLRLVADVAWFRFPEVRLGLLPTNGVHHLLPRLVGAGRAAEWLLSGRRVAAAEALATGLVNRVVPADLLADEAEALAARLASASPAAVKAVRRLLADGEMDLEACLERETEALVDIATGDDAVEGLLAASEGRAPRFR